MFDWIQFFEQNNIHYVTSGPNVSRNQVAIKCCWCGASDDSQHLSINLEGKGFRCWRAGKAHSGKNPAKLIQALLNCSWQQAESIAGNSKTLPDDFMTKIRSTIHKEQTIQPMHNLKLPIEFKKFSKLPSCKMYLDYINSRGFTIQDTVDYDVYYASQGLYKGRILFMVVQDSKLCGWTGRTVYSSENARYKTLTNDIDKAKENGEIPAPNPISHYLLWYDRLVETDADTIVLCEGPFDAWKVNILGGYIGVLSTCFFTSTLSNEQLNLLHGILPHFKNRFLLLDQNTFAKAQRIRVDLSSLDVVVKSLPRGVKDPAELQTTKQLKDILSFDDD